VLAREALAVESINVVLAAENEARCQPPLEADEVRRLAEGAVRYATTEEGQRATLLDEFANRTRLLDDGELEALLSPSWLVPGLLVERSQALLYAPPGAGKTFLALDLAFTVRAGLEWHGRQTQSGSVVYVIGEGGAGIKNRVRAWKHVHDMPGTVGVLFHPAPVNLMNTADVQRFIENVAAHNPDFIVFDTLARCMVGGDDSSSKDMGVCVESLELVRTELRATVLTLHHPTKKGDSERGSGALLGAMDTAIRLDLTKNERVITMTCEKQKDAEEFEPIYLALKPLTLPDGATSCVVEDSLPPQKPTRTGKKKTSASRSSSAGTSRSSRAGTSRIMALLKDATDGLSTKAIKTALSDVPERTLHNWLRELRESNQLVSEGGVYRVATGDTASAS